MDNRRLKIILTSQAFRNRLIFWAIIGLALAVRVYYFSYSGWRSDRDFVVYGKIIENIAAGDKSALSHVVIPPYFFFVAAVICWLGVPVLYAAVATSIASGIILVATTYFLAQKLFNQKIMSFMLMLIVVFMPQLVIINCSPIRDSLGIALNVICLTLLLYGLESEKRLFFGIAGLCMGVGAMVRTENVEICILAVLCLLLMVCKRVRNRNCDRHYVLQVLLHGVAFLGLALVVYVALSLYAETWGYNWRLQLCRYLNVLRSK